MSHSEFANAVKLIMARYRHLIDTQLARGPARLSEVLAAVERRWDRD